MKNILVSTFGTTWHLLPELLGFTNLASCDFYNNHTKRGNFEALCVEYNIRPVNEVWLITTDNPQTQKAIDSCRAWIEAKKLNVDLHMLSVKGLEDLRSVEDCRTMKNLIYRAVLNAKKEANGGDIILSMVGGYKTMSSDLQSAGHIFGCVESSFQCNIRQVSPKQLIC